MWDLEVKILGIDLPDSIEDGLVPFALKKALAAFALALALAPPGSHPLAYSPPNDAVPRVRLDPAPKRSLDPHPSQVLARFNPDNPIVVPINITDAIHDIDFTDSLAGAVNQAIKDDPELGGMPADPRAVGSSAGGGGGHAGGGGGGPGSEELKMLRVAVVALAVTLVVLGFVMACMLGAAISQLSAVQASMAEQADTLDACFQPLLGTSSR